MKKVLIISPHFPPVNAPDMQRVRMSLPYFEEMGWRATVICVAAEYVEAAQDPVLLKTIPSTVEVHRVKAMKASVTRKFGLGSLSMRSFFTIRKKGNELLKSGQFDLIYFSTTAFHVCRLGPYWKRKFDVPFIIDMQDPWRNDFYLSKPKSQRPPKFRVAYTIDKTLEASTIPEAAGIISVSQGYIEELRMRYPSISQRPAKVVSFGFEPDDIQIAAALPAPPLQLPAGKFNFVYIGRGGYDLEFALSIIFSGFKKRLNSSPLMFGNVHFTFIGTSYAATGTGMKTVLPVAESFGLEDYVSEITDRVPYFQTLQLLQRADALIVPGSTDTSYTASKIYPYLQTAKRLFAVFHSKSSVVDVLESAGVDTVVQFDNFKPVSAYADAAAAILETIVTDQNDMIPDNNSLKAYTAKAKTAEQTDFFNTVTEQYVSARNIR